MTNCRAKGELRANAGDGPRLDEFRSNFDFKKQTTWETKQENATAVARQEFQSGDRVKHHTFGDGVVVSSKMNGGDEELEVAFVEKGVKRLIAAYAKLEKR